MTCILGSARVLFAVSALGCSILGWVVGRPFASMMPRRVAEMVAAEVRSRFFGVGNATELRFAAGAAGLWLGSGRPAAHQCWSMPRPVRNNAPIFDCIN